MAADHNIGSICLQTIASTWQVDDSAINWVENGFDWHPGSHLIRVRAHKHHEKERWRISVETDLLTSVPIEDVKFARRIAAFCSTASSTYSMPYPPVEIWKSFAEPVLKDDSPKLSLFSSIYVSPELLEWLPKFFAGEAICQVINAEFLSDSVSALAGGKPDHLPSGQNKNPDEIFQVLSTMFIPEGKRPSRWKGTKEFVEVAKKYGKSDVCFGMGEDFGLTLETPFGARSTLIQLRSDVQHPQLGTGLLVTIQFPFQGGAEEIEKESANLNFLEARKWTDIPQLGCWMPRMILSADGKTTGVARLAHASFVPNLLYSDGIATNFAVWSVARARWVREERWPKLEDKPMIEILNSRWASHGHEGTASALSG